MVKTKKPKKKSIKKPPQPTPQPPSPPKQHWLESQLKKSQINLTKEREKRHKEAEAFLSNPHIQELKTAYNIIISELMHNNVYQDDFLEYF